MHALNAVNSTSIHELQTDTKMLPMEIGMLPRKTAMLPRKTAMLPRKTAMLPVKTGMLLVNTGMLLVNTGTGGAIRQCCPDSLPFNCGEICKKENTHTPLTRTTHNIYLHILHYSRIYLIY